MAHVAEDTLDNLNARLTRVRAAIARLEEQLEVASTARDDRSSTFRRLEQLEASEKRLMDRIANRQGGNLVQFVPVDC